MAFASSTVLSLTDIYHWRLGAVFTASLLCGSLSQSPFVCVRPKSTSECASHPHESNSWIHISAAYLFRNLFRFGFKKRARLPPTSSSSSSELICFSFRVQYLASSSGMSADQRRRQAQPFQSKTCRYDNKFLKRGPALARPEWHKTTCKADSGILERKHRPAAQDSTNWRGQVGAAEGQRRLQGSRHPVRGLVSSRRTTSQTRPSRIEDNTKHTAYTLNHVNEFLTFPSRRSTETSVTCIPSSCQLWFPTVFHCFRAAISNHCAWHTGEPRVVHRCVQAIWGKLIF